MIPITAPIGAVTLSRGASCAMQGLWAVGGLLPFNFSMG